MISITNQFIFQGMALHDSNDINANFKAAHFANSVNESDDLDSSITSSGEESNTGTIKRSPLTVMSAVDMPLEDSQEHSGWQRDVNRSFRSNHAASPAYEPVVNELSERLGSAKSSNSEQAVANTNTAADVKRQVVKKARGNSVFYDEVPVEECVVVTGEITPKSAEAGEADYDDVPAAGT